MYRKTLIHVYIHNIIQTVLVKEFGADWRSKLKEFDEKPFAAASIGQVNKNNVMLITFKTCLSNLKNLMKNTLLQLLLDK